MTPFLTAAQEGIQMVEEQKHTPVFKTVTVYETRDRKRHDEERRAIEWAQWIDDVDAANALYEAGASLADVMDRANATLYLWRTGEKQPHRAVFAHITKDTLLKISHWQCHDKPVYQVHRLKTNGKFDVGGVGGWSGYYGRDVDESELARYAENTFAAALSKAGA